MVLVGRKASYQMGVRLCYWLVFSVLLACSVRPGLAAAGLNVGEIQGHWAEEFLIEAVARELVKGYPDGSIRPDRGVTRAEFAAMVLRGILGEPSDRVGRLPSLFTDVDLNHWGRGYVICLAEMGILKGNDRGEARPDDPIRRIEAIAMLDRWLVMASVRSNGRGPEFRDMSAVPQWGLDAVCHLSALGIVKGDDQGNLRPGDNVTRAEAVTLILRTMGVLGRRWDLEGTVAGIDQRSGEFRLMCEGRTLSLRWVPDTVSVYNAGKAVGLGSVRLGDRVKVVLDGSRRVVGMIVLEE